MPTDKMIALLRMLGEKHLLNQPAGQRGLSSLFSYAAPAKPLGHPVNNELYQSLSRLRELPKPGMPGGPTLFSNLIGIPSYHLLVAEDKTNKISKDKIGDIIRHACLIEFGIGDGSKTRQFCELVGPPARIVGIDISVEHLSLSKTELSHVMPENSIRMIEADFSRRNFWKMPFWKEIRQTGLPLIGFIPGSTLGNSTLPDAEEFMRNARSVADEFLCALDSTQDPELLDGAYGTGAAPEAKQFHLNGFDYARRVLDLEPLPKIDERFDYRMRFDKETCAVEAKIVSKMRQKYVSSHSWGTSLVLEEGEEIRCITSHKWPVPMIEGMFGRAGWEVASRMSFADAILKDEDFVATLPFSNHAHNVDYNIYHLI